MRMTLEEYKKRFPGRPDPPPPEYAGQWVAWNREQSRILAHGYEFAEVRAQARAAGCERPIMQKVISVPFIGAA